MRLAWPPSEHAERGPEDMSLIPKRAGPLVITRLAGRVAIHILGTLADLNGRPGKVIGIILRKNQGNPPATWGDLALIRLHSSGCLEGRDTHMNFALLCRTAPYATLLQAVLTPEHKNRYAWLRLLHLDGAKHPYY